MIRRPYKRYLQEDVEIPRSSRYKRLRAGHNNEIIHDEHVADFAIENEVTHDLVDNNSISERSSTASSVDLNHLVNDEVDNQEFELSSNSSMLSDSPSNSNNDLEENSEDQIDRSSDSSDTDNMSDDQIDEDDVFFDAENEPVIEDLLYPGAHITKKQSEALILSYATRYHLSEIALRDIILLINAHTPHPVHQSKYFFLKDLNIEKNVEYYFFCKICQDALTFENNTTVSQCLNRTCELFEIDQEQKSLRKNGHFFLHKSLAKQLKLLLNNPAIYAKLDRSADTGDVSSASMYRQLVQEKSIGPLDITLQWNTDGASASNSSNCSIWPIQVAINELPYSDRSENIILASLWQGNKPKMDTFLRPFVDELRLLHREGITLNNGLQIKVHCLIATVDSVARPLLQNIKQFNGAYGCSYCLNPGQRIAVGRKGGSARVYIGLVEETRDCDQHFNDATEAVDTGVCVRGVNGPSLLMLIPLFNMITSFTPDYLHACLLGTTKWFLGNWIDSKNSEHPWYIGAGQKYRVLSNRLTSIKPPTEITRCPRPLRELKMWKASEYRSFLLYYSIPCLKGLLPVQFLKHWLLFVYGISHLLKDRVGNLDIERSQACLAQFVQQTEALYGAEWMTFNMHIILHLATAVRNLGPLWSSSTFMYEHFNGVLLNLFSGTQNISGQIFRNYERVKQVNNILGTAQLEHWNPMAEKLVKNLAGKYFSVRAVKCGKLVVFGAPKIGKLNLNNQSAIENLLGEGLIDRPFQMYHRFLINGLKINTSEYKLMKRRKNSVVQLNDLSYLNISELVDLGGNYELRYIVVGKRLRMTNEDICVNGQFKATKVVRSILVEDGPETVAVQPNDIFCKCVYMDIDGGVYICRLVNKFERD